MHALCAGPDREPWNSFSYTAHKQLHTQRNRRNITTLENLWNNPVSTRDFLRDGGEGGLEAHNPSETCSARGGASAMTDGTSGVSQQQQPWWHLFSIHAVQPWLLSVQEWLLFSWRRHAFFSYIFVTFFSAKLFLYLEELQLDIIIIDFLFS